MEQIRLVHAPWVELNKEHDISGSPAGKIHILDLAEDRLLARHSSLLTLCAQQKA